MSISAEIGFAPQTLNEWVKKIEVDRGERAGVTTEMAERLLALERVNRELKQANEILRKGVRVFCPSSRRLLATACRAKGRSATADRSHDRLHTPPGRALRSNVPRGTITMENSGSKPEKLWNLALQAEAGIMIPIRLSVWAKANAHHNLGGAFWVHLRNI